MATSCAKRVRSHSARYSGSSRSPACSSLLVLRSLTFITQLLHALYREPDRALELTRAGLGFRSHSHDHEDIADATVEGSPCTPSRTQSQLAQATTSSHITLMWEG